MPMPREDDYKLVNKNQDDAIAELVDAVLGGRREVRSKKYGELVYKAAWKVTDACQAPMPTEGNYELVNKNPDDAIAELVDAVLGERREVRPARHGELVYQVAWKVAEACKALNAVYNYRLTDIEEYKAEVERRRQIGLTIDPATAETMFWWADIHDPYDILDPRSIMKDSPAGSTLLEILTGTGLISTTCDGHKLVFPYGLHPGDDLINYPPASQS